MLASVAFALALALTTAHAQSPATAHLRTGKEIYEAGCAGCHGGKGRGAPQSTTVFERPGTFPDFTRCDQTTPEPNETWKSVIRDGGPARGFSPIMPSFGEALTMAQIDAVVEHIRGFCKEKAWPRGELNLPRALGTEKAFPEGEVLIGSTVNVKGAPGLSHDIVYERRISARNQMEVTVPLEFQRPQRGRWYGGTGDVSLGLKRVLLSSLGTGSILSVQGEAILPAGNSAHGLGSGTPAFETFAAYGQLLPANYFLQFQGGGSFPTDTERAPRAGFFRAVAGRSLNQNKGLGRMWSPMVEFLADRDFETGAKTNWDVMPEVQVTLSKRQHVRLNVGLRIPATNTRDRNPQLMFYLLWDYVDGKLLEGWK
jgi:mono/diheme cytochrome c family protein